MTQPARPSAAAITVAVLVGIWAVAVTLALQSVGWVVDLVLLSLGIDRPWWTWLVISLINAALVAVPAALLATLAAAAPVRAAGRAWLAGASAVGLLGAVRAVPAAEAEVYLALLALAAIGLGFAWRRRTPTDRTNDREEAAGGSLPAAVTAGVVVLVPWLWLGALGGVLETALALAAAAALGWLAASILDLGFWAAIARTRVRRILLGGLVAGVTLLLAAAGTGASGAQLAALLVLPPVGFAAAALRRGWLVLVGFAALGPLAFVDAEEITLLLLDRDVPFWAGLAAGGSLALGLLVGLAYLFLLHRPRPAWLCAAVAVALVVAGAGVYAGAGQPGFHGERLFVVMADQADLSGIPPATGPGGRDARAAEVYQRLVAHAQASQAGLRAELDRLRLPYTPYYLVNAVEVAGGRAVGAWLSRRDDVDRVLPSQQLRPLPVAPPVAHGTAGLTPEDPAPNIALIRADQVWDELGVTGTGIVVGTSDSGVDGGHPALAGGFRGGDDSWHDAWHGTTTPTDRGGHGTHTLGSAVGRGGIGVAPGAEWTGCVNLDRNLGNPAVYLDCLQFMLAPYPSGADPFRDGRPERAPHVLTNSWGCPPIEGCDTGSLRPATAALAAAGIYVVAAAGNTGPRCGSIEDPPAPYPDVLTVGAVDQEREPALFSSRGAAAGAGKPDLVAPGVGVVSAMPGGGYARLSGTSMATPHLAGVVALMWSANGSLIGDVATTTRILRDTARPLPEPDEFSCGGGGAVTGAGLVDAHAAVLAAQKAQ